MRGRSCEGGFGKKSAVFQRNSAFDFRHQKGIGTIKKEVGKPTSFAVLRILKRSFNIEHISSAA